ncbi:dopaminechrome tautomerase-like isoform X2 [Onthophagus taurus]|uniref:dopaminechrome tautomerase-like isoform X2 n=1 Tax=Onthophagus taurus TaxID=166361 RepID=UPI000C20518D|nr:protein yellow-like isoform X2 [Onthophagus taurus]
MALSSSWYDFQNSDVHVENNVFHQMNSTNYDTRLNYGILPYLLSLGALLTTPLKQEERKEVFSEKSGPFKTVFQWSQIDFLFESEVHRNSVLASGNFIQENNLPLGIEVYKNRIFISLPVWKSGVPATLTVLPTDSLEKSPLLVPYPNWSWHNTGSCNRLTSVFRMQADVCDRLWVLDSGQINVATESQQVCPPSILIFDLSTDKLILKYDLPQELVKQDSLYSNILIDVQKDDCSSAHAYLADVWRFGLVVFNLKTLKAWRVTDHLFFPDPLAAAYKVNGLEFEWTDGIFGLALSPFNKYSIDRTLYFNPMSSFREFYTKTSIIRNETGWSSYKDAFKVYGQSRGKNGQASSCAMDRNGVLFFGLVTQNALGCWDSRKTYKRKNLAIIAQNDYTMVFPNDVKVDNEPKQSVWMITNRLPFFIYNRFEPKDVNFRVLSAYAEEMVKGTICDPKVRHSGSYTNDYNECF